MPHPHIKSLSKPKFTVKTSQIPLQTQKHPPKLKNTLPNSYLKSSKISSHSTSTLILESLLTSFICLILLFANFIESLYLTSSNYHIIHICFWINSLWPSLEFFQVDEYHLGLLDSPWHLFLLANQIHLQEILCSVSFISLNFINSFTLLQNAGFSLRNMNYKKIAKLWIKAIKVYFYCIFKCFLIKKLMVIFINIKI